MRARLARGRVNLARARAAWRAAIFRLLGACLNHGRRCCGPAAAGEHDSDRLLRAGLFLLAVVGFICSAHAGGAPVSDLDVIRGSAVADGFARVLAPRTFEFPRDHGPHPEFRDEWWYVTGNLDSANGQRFGFELTIFRVGLAPLVGVGSGAQPVGANGARGSGAASASAGGAGSGGAAPRVGETAAGVAGESAVAGGAGLVAGNGARGTGAAAASAWRTRQVYVAHFAITDVARGEFKFAQKYSRDALGLAGAQAEPFRVWVDDWVLGSPSLLQPASPAQGDPTRAAGSPGPTPGSPWTLHARSQDYELTLDAELLGQPVLNGDRGLSRKSAEPGAASYYYSIPRIAVHGKIVRAGVSSDVQGLAWLDREWGSGPLGAKEQGWDWFALQLQDGSTLMFYALRNHDGTRDPNSAGTWVDSAGRAQSLSTDQVTIDVSDHWTSPRGGRYPSRWRVRVPAVGLDVEIRPVLANQELGTQPRYWEGTVDLRGVREGHDATGRGYVELVGYGE
jgi:predicted secreted hydrolase